MFKLLFTIFSAFATLALLGVGALVLNRLPWDQPPGFSKRLQTYLSENLVETRADHPWPELRSRDYPSPPDELFPVVKTAIENLGWDIRQADPRRHNLVVEVTTPLFRFKDDLEATIEALPDGGSRLQIQSQSRLGKADLGANDRHVMDLYQAVSAIQNPQ